MPTPQTRYLFLKELGIQSWVLRSSLLEFKRPLWGARLGVLLSEKILPNTEEHKVLMGMLSVLNLSENHYWIAWVKDKKTQLLFKEIYQWSPAHVLFMGRSFKEILNEIGSKDDSNPINIFQNTDFHESFHPRELVLAPEHKKTAYQQLLRLKERLH